MRKICSCLALALAGLCLAGGALADEIKVLSAGAIKPVIVAALPEFERRNGHKVTVENDTAGGLLRRVRSGGVAVRQGAPLPDVSSTAAFRAALLAARNVAYIDPAAGGSSGIYLAQLFERMGIAAQIKPKAVLVPGGLVAQRLLTGEADLAVHQISEILAAPQVRAQLAAQGMEAP
ncbi:MAG: bacterial extracellular solute-binding family protein [Ramlibacter sp.]|jgi:molybdate transport system substrate-binding protein|nr:bacterial extracellular solute-binding family protein [Ramlibacter sp.]